MVDLAKELCVFFLNLKSEKSLNFAFTHRFGGPVKLQKKDAQSPTRMTSTIYTFFGSKLIHLPTGIAGLGYM